MIVYQEAKKQFLHDVRLDLIEDKIEQKLENDCIKRQRLMNLCPG